MKPPFPWFGGKSRVAPLVWERFGDVAAYVEPVRRVAGNAAAAAALAVCGEPSRNGERRRHRRERVEVRTMSFAPDESLMPRARSLVATLRAKRWKDREHLKDVLSELDVAVDMSAGPIPARNEYWMHQAAVRQLAMRKAVESLERANAPATQQESPSPENRCKI